VGGGKQPAWVKAVLAGLFAVRGAGALRRAVRNGLQATGNKKGAEAPFLLR
jgi:hypothetical protein